MDVIRFLKLLFCFKKPGVINLSYLHVFIKDKPTLFVVWEIKNVWFVKLIPLRRRYDAAQKALVISMPNEQRWVTLYVANFWRRTKINLILCAVHLDEAATAQLIKGFRPLNKVEVSAPRITSVLNRVSLKSSSLKQRNSVIKKIDRFNIDLQPFNYP